MNNRYYPSPQQTLFFEDTISDADKTILTLKRIENDRRGFSVNIRGPFRLVHYEFEDNPSENQVVIDAIWAGKPESKSHLHCCWEEVKFAKLSRTNSDVQRNIGALHQLAFFSDPTKAEKGDNNEGLFWFYLENGGHKATNAVKEGIVIDISKWPAARLSAAPQNQLPTASQAQAR